MNQNSNKEVKYEVFRGVFSSWNQLFKDASEYASHLEAGKLISISHSADHSDGVVVVWYWE